MKRAAALSILILLAGSSSASWAAAGPEQAQRLTALFQSYLGSEPGVVTVQVAGDAYRARFDAAPYIAKFARPGFAASLTPVELTLSDLGGGKWKVDQDQPLSVAVSVEGQVEFRASLARVQGTGMFDEALGGFASTAADLTQLAVEQTVTEAGQAATIAYTIAAIHQESAMSGTGEKADATTAITLTDIRQTISMPPAADGSMPGMDIAITASGGAQNGKVGGFRPRALAELAAWLVAHPSPDAIKAGQSALKDRLRAALPVFESLSGTSTFNDISFNTTLGRFGVKALAVDVDMTGILASGSFRERIGISGLSLPDGIVPPWAAGLAPESFSLDIGVADYDLDAPARIVLDALDLDKDPPLPPETEAALQKALLPKGTVTLTLGPSALAARAFDLKAEGLLTAGPMAPPAGNALLRLKGIDAIVAALQAAPAEMGAQQIMPLILMAKGVAKQEPDGALSWRLESASDGALTINGIDSRKIGGQ